jgi:hypothetical protein
MVAAAAPAASATPAAADGQGDDLCSYSSASVCVAVSKY